MLYARTLSIALILSSAYSGKTPDSAVCDSKDEASVIRFAHSIKKFTDMCITGGYPNCEDQKCKQMLNTLTSDNCHQMVMKCAADQDCTFHAQAVPYKQYVGGMATTCVACLTNPEEVLKKMEANTKRATAVCKFEDKDEPNSHALCQTHECHEAMKHVNLKCLSAWVRGFAWIPDATAECQAKIAAYTKASITCDPSEAQVQFASSASQSPKSATASPTGELQKYIASLAPGSVMSPARTVAPTEVQSSPAAMIAPMGAAIFLAVVMAELATCI
jgi:hypothetical protein